MKTLSNRDISNLSKHVETYEEKVLEGLYEHYRTVLSFINGNSMRGEAGEATVTYLNNVHLYLINKFMNVISELASDMKHIEEAFLAYETSNYGIVNSSLVNSKQTEIKQIFNQFDTLDNELNTLTSEINYIPGVSSLKSSVLINEFNKTFDKMDEIVDNLEEKDLNLTNHLESLSARVQELKTAIKDVEAHFKTDGGFSSEKVSNIESSSWYTQEKNDVFADLYRDSPFVVDEVKETAYTQEVGFVTDFGTNVSGVYVADRGYSVNGDMTNFTATGHFSGLEAKSEFTGDYINSTTSAKVLYGDGELSFKNGVNMEANVGVAQAHTDFMVGWDDWNVHASGDAGVLTAEGKFQADTGGLALKGEAALYYVEAKGGVTLANTDIDVGISHGKVGGGLGLTWDKVEIEIHGWIVGGSLSIDFPW
ncbi:T7SS effector LXG polymorphic toxin [Salipaludibacillus agaradhaerens]|uniref:T7SS effector LXG polymorphic toxin n=1 Tax=Salipaludibacillus agaradhaerens TaxID=76935 RepID=UPI000997E287|nr:T7SS effector LXG polymorphic toxin [Salipaludibacillus agaradhaerens]